MTATLICRSTRSTRRAARASALGAALLLHLLAWAGASNMLVSNRDRGLAVNAWGGLRDGASLRLHNACRGDNPDCAWSYRGGQIFAQGRDGAHFIRASKLEHGATLVVAKGCPRDAAGCGWIYRDGMFVSEQAPTLAIAAWGGARFGTPLRLSNECRANNPDCTWSR